MDYYQRYTELTEQPIEEQAKFFLRSFVLEFQGKFEEILELCQTFKKFSDKGGEVKVLNEFETHRFLEHVGETLTVRELRDHLREIELDKSNPKISYVEYLLWKYGKNLELLFNPPGDVSPEILAMLEKAIQEYQEVLDKRAKREARMAELEKLAQEGGVKGLRAKNELEQMKAEDLLEQNKREITTAAKKRRAEKLAKDGNEAREKALKEEQARLEKLKREKEEEERRKREESRRRLAEKASLFNK